MGSGLNGMELPSALAPSREVHALSSIHIYRLVRAYIY